MTAWCSMSGRVVIAHRDGRVRCPACGRRVVARDGRLRNHRLPGAQGDCAVCGAPFVAGEIGRPRLYCGRSCQNVAGERARQKRDARGRVA